MRRKHVLSLLERIEERHSQEVSRMQSIIDAQAAQIADLMNRVMTTNYREYKTFSLGDLPIGDHPIDMRTMDELAGGIFTEEELSGGTNGKTEEDDLQ